MFRWNRLFWRPAGLLLVSALLPACGLSGGGGTLTPTVAPQIPAAFTGVSGPRRAALSWASSPGASSYTVRRSMFSGGPFTDLPGATGVSCLSLVDAGLQNGTPYYYVLRANNSFGTSTDSAEVKVVPGLKAVQAAAGSNFSAALLEDGSIWAWGDNQYGQLGLPTAPLSTVAVEIHRPASMPPILSIQCGPTHVVVLDSQGRVWAWGDNSSGQIGNDSGPTILTPTRVEGISDVLQVSAGTGFTLALRRDGTVWVWGDNTFGQLGNGSGPNVSAPQQVPNLSEVTMISAGDQYSLALRSDGTVWAWGWSSVQDPAVLLGTGLVEPPMGSVVPVTSLDNIISISAGKPGIINGGAHSMAIDADGNVWTWGSNSYGALGDGTGTDSPFRILVASLPAAVAVSSGGRHSLVLAADGTVWGFGDDSQGQLGVMANPGPFNPIETPLQALGIQHIRSISAGLSHSLAVGEDGTIWGFGTDSEGELGNGGGAFQSNPVQIQNLDSVVAITACFQHSYALRTDGSIWAWGDSSFGQAGTGSSAAPVTPVRVNPPPIAAALGAGGFEGYAILADGSVWAWGFDEEGQLGRGAIAPGAYTPDVIPGLAGISAVAGGYQHEIALSASDGSVWAWGFNGAGQLGSGIAGNASIPVPVMTSGGGGLVPLQGMTAISAGVAHNLALKSDGTVWVWGDNVKAQLGVSLPPPFTASNEAIQTPGLSGIVAVAGGYQFSLALQNDGTVWAWGDNSQGQLGFDPATMPDPAHPWSVTPTPVAGLSGIVAIAAGYYQGLALGSDGTVWIWGLTGLGVSGSPPGTAYTPIAVPGLPPAQSIAGAYGFSLALGQDGRVYGWGINNLGQMALAPTGSVALPLQITH